MRMRLALVALAALVAPARCSVSGGFLADFEHGVASGDPHSSSVVLWTRVTPRASAPAAINVTWLVLREGEELPERTGVFKAIETTDWTVKLIADGLAHSTRYQFYFTVGEARSPLGRFRLPPPETVALSSLRYAIFSCSSWSWGHFHAYAEAAKTPELDFWMHVGDWMYEYGQEGHYPAPSQAVRFAGLEPAGETITLDDYRRRHALHRRDAHLQSLSAAAPLIAVWDDHESANDPWVGGAQDHNPDEGEGDWWARKRAAVKAYHEWMPTRTPPPPSCDPSAPSSAVGVASAACTGSHEGEAIYRQVPAVRPPSSRRATAIQPPAAVQPAPAAASTAPPPAASTSPPPAALQFRFGSLASLVVLETRLLARSEQAYGNGAAAAAVAEVVGATPPARWADDPTLLASLSSLNASWRAARENASRQMLGEAQLSWLEGAVRDASASAVVWQLVGQQIIVQGVRPADLRLAADRAPAGVAEEWRSLIDALADEPPPGEAALMRERLVSYDGRSYAAADYGRPTIPLTPQVRAKARGVLAQAAFGLVSDFDGWAGYPAARGRLLASLRGAASGSGRVAVYAGDSHCAWAGRLVDEEDGAHVALEFDGAGVTSPGADTWLPFLPPALLASGFVQATPSLEYANTHDNGWMDVSLTPTEHVVTFMTVPSVGSAAPSAASCDARFAQFAHEPDRLVRLPCPPAVPSGVLAEPTASPAAATADSAPAMLGGVGIGVLLTLVACGVARAFGATRGAKPLLASRKMVELGVATSALASPSSALAGRSAPAS